MSDLQRGGFVVAYAPTRYLQINLYIQRSPTTKIDDDHRPVGKWTMEVRAGSRPDIYARKLIGFGTWWSPTDMSIRTASKEWQITRMSSGYRVQISTHPIMISHEEVEVPGARLDFRLRELSSIEESE